MNYFFLFAIHITGEVEGAGGLFDFNVTLPLMAIQFIALTVLLIFVFYKPIAKALDDRASYITGNLIAANEKLRAADDVYKEYTEKLKFAKVSAQCVLAESEKEAKDVVAKEVADARADAARTIRSTVQKLRKEKIATTFTLEKELVDFVQLINAKLLMLPDFGDLRKKV
jgi:F-type H+-transporting ATPase subunit b